MGNIQCLYKYIVTYKMHIYPKLIKIPYNINDLSKYMRTHVSGDNYSMEKYDEKNQSIFPLFRCYRRFCQLLSILVSKS